MLLVGPSGWLHSAFHRIQTPAPSPVPVRAKPLHSALHCIQTYETPAGTLQNQPLHSALHCIQTCYHSGHNHDLSLVALRSSLHSNRKNGKGSSRVYAVALRSSLHSNVDMLVRLGIKVFCCTPLFIAFKQLFKRSVPVKFILLHSALHRIQTHKDGFSILERAGLHSALHRIQTRSLLGFLWSFRVALCSSSHSNERRLRIYMTSQASAVALCSSSHSNVLKQVEEEKPILAGCTLLFIAFKQRQRFKKS